MDVVCVLGGKISNVKPALCDLSDVTHDKWILVVGGNDCDTRDANDIKTASAIIDDYRTLVSVAKTKAERVIVSTVVPRLKSLEVRTRIDDVNAGLQVMCGDEDVTFVDNTNSFHLGDGSINDGYYEQDGTHLITKATNKLLYNLQMKRKDGISSASNHHRHQKSLSSDPPITSSHHEEINTRTRRSGHMLDAWLPVGTLPLVLIIVEANTDKQWSTVIIIWTMNHIQNRTSDATIAMRSTIQSEHATTNDLLPVTSVVWRA